MGMTCPNLASLGTISSDTAYTMPDNVESHYIQANMTFELDLKHSSTLELAQLCILLQSQLPTNKDHHNDGTRGEELRSTP